MIHQWLRLLKREARVNVDDLINQSVANKFQINEGKCKELRIGFSKLTTNFEPIKIHGNFLEVVKCAKILGLTVSDDLKWNEHAIQRRALKMVFPRTTYDEALSRTGLQTLYARRRELTERLFRDIESNNEHKLHNLLPPLIEIDTTLGNKSKYNVTFKTELFRNSFITYNALKS